MDLILWLVQQSESEIKISQKINLNSIILLAYFVVYLFNRRPSFLAAFFISCALFELKVFDPLSEFSLYLLTFLVYSYVIKCHRNSKLTIIACLNMLVVCMVLSYNARFYGYPDYYGEVDEFIYNNIEYVSLFSHGFIIYSLVNFKAVRNRLRNIAGFIRGMSYHTVNFTVL